MKTHYFGVVTAPLLTNDLNESLIPMSLTVHGGKTTTKVSSMVACIEEQKSEIEKDDLVALVGGQDFFPCSSEAKSSNLILDDHFALNKIPYLMMISSRYHAATQLEHDIVSLTAGVVVHDDPIIQELSPAPPHFEDGVTFTVEQHEKLVLGIYTACATHSFRDGTSRMGATQSPMSPCSIQGLFWTVLHNRTMRFQAYYIVVHRLVVKPHASLRLYKQRENMVA